MDLVCSVVLVLACKSLFVKWNPTRDPSEALGKSVSCKGHFPASSVAANDPKHARDNEANLRCPGAILFACLKRVDASCRPVRASFMF